MSWSVSTDLQNTSRYIYCGKIPAIVQELLVTPKKHS
jgi:hypothetical protein